MLLAEANLTLDAFLILPDGLVTIVTFKARGYTLCNPRDEPHFAGPGFSEMSPERIKT